MEQLQAPNSQFWQGLDPTKPERLSKVLAALHCFHIAPPADLFHCEFTVHPDDHHRIYVGFPELQFLEKLIGKRIPFVSGLATLHAADRSPLSGSPSPFAFHFLTAPRRISTHQQEACRHERTGHHRCLIRVLAAKIDNGLESLYDQPGSVGELARTVIPWDDYRIENGKMIKGDGQPANVTNTPTLGYGCLPSRYSMLAVDYAGQEKDAPSKHTQHITAHGARTAISLQLSFPQNDRLDVKEKYERMATNSAVWVWTEVDGTVKPVVHDQRLSTPGGQIELWLSDFVPDGTTLPDAFVRPVHGE